MARVFMAAKVEPELKEELQRVATAEHRSLSNLIELAVIKLLEERKNGRDVQR